METGWTISNMGQNSCEIPAAASAFLVDIVLLISPSPMVMGEWVPNTQLIDDSRTFARFCQTLAKQMGIRFDAAGRWDILLAYDGVHFTKQGGKVFVIKLLEELR